jgi:hypothetical protein
MDASLSGGCGDSIGETLLSVTWHCSICLNFLVLQVVFALSVGPILESSLLPNSLLFSNCHGLSNSSQQFMLFFPGVICLFVSSFLFLQIYFDKHSGIFHGMNTIPNQYTISDSLGFGKQCHAAGSMLELFLAPFDAPSLKMVLNDAIQHHSGEATMEVQISWFKINIGCTSARQR